MSTKARPSRSRRLFAPGLVLAVLITTAPAADAEQPPLPGPEATRSWGVAERGVSEANGAAPDALVWDIEVVGEVVYVAGTFLDLAEPRDASRHRQSYVAAFDVSTGDWIETWRPELNAAAYSLATTPSGAVLVGGEFTSVNGDATRQGVVALDPVTGAIDPGFTASTERRRTTAPMVVRDLYTTGDRLYVVGNFNHVTGGPAARTVCVYKAARLDRATGVPDPQWRPCVTGRSVYAVAESSDGPRVHLGGEFSAVSGAPGTGLLATVTTNDGELVGGWAHGPEFPGKGLRVNDLDVSGDSLVVAGAKHFYAIFSSLSGEEIAMASSSNDTQSVDIIGNVAYIGCHCRKSPERWAAVVDIGSGEIVHSYTSSFTGSDGVWTVAQAPDGCVWTGGALTSTRYPDGSQGWAGNLIRSCPAGGPAPYEPPGPTPTPTPPTTAPDAGTPSVPTGLTASFEGDSVALNWQAATDDVGVIGYLVYRNGAYLGWTPTTTYTDPAPPAGTNSYQLRSHDAGPNRSEKSAPLSVTV